MSVENLLKTRHKFKSFTQRIRDIHPDLTNNFDLTIDQPNSGENGSFFNDHLKATMKTCLDIEYSRFVSQILRKTDTLPMILYNKDVIFGAILEYLGKPFDLIKGSLENVLILISRLARDLQYEFYPYFNKIFLALVEQFNPNEPSFVESFFQCIIFLLKFLMKSLVQDLDNVFDLFVNSFFYDEKDFSRRLGSETLAFLLRHVPKKIDAHIKLIKLCQMAFEAKKDEPLNAKEGQILMPYDQRIIESLGMVFYFETKNVNGSIRSYSTEIVDWVFSEKFEIGSQSFLYCMEKLSSHTEIPHHVEFLSMLFEKMPNVESTLCLNVMSIWMSKNEGKFIDNHSQLIKVLERCLAESSTQSLTDFLYYFNTFNCINKASKAIIESIIKLIKTESSFEKLQECRLIAMVSCPGVLDFITDNPSYILNIKPVLDWINPSPSVIPEKLITIVNEMFHDHRKQLMPILKYIHNIKSYEIVRSLENKSLEELSTFYTLMGFYEPQEIIKQPPFLLEQLSGSLNQSESLNLVLHLIEVTESSNPEWLVSSSSFFSKMFDLIDYNTSDFIVQKLSIQILSHFLPPNRQIYEYEQNELLVYCSNLVFNAEHSLTGYKEGESAINRLNTEVNKIKDTHKLLNLAFGFARQMYINFRTGASSLIGSIIKFQPKEFGPLVTKQIKENLGNPSSSMFVTSLINSLINAMYVDQNVVTILSSLAGVEEHTTEEEEIEDDSDTKETSIPPKVIALLINSFASVRTSETNIEMIDKATSLLLQSSNIDVRKASFSVQFRIHIENNRSINEQIRQKIQKNVEAFIDPKSNTDIILQLPAFLEDISYERTFVSRTSVLLSVGVLKEYLTEKSRQKHRYSQVSKTVLQALSIFTTDEMYPLINAVFPNNPSTKQLRQVSLFLEPILSRLSKHISPFINRISDILISSILSSSKTNSKYLTSAIKASVLFVESVPDLFNFSSRIIEIAEIISEHNIHQIISLLLTISRTYPAVISERETLMERIIKRISSDDTHNHSELIQIAAASIPFCRQLLSMLFENVKILLSMKKIIYKPSVVDSLIKLFQSVKSFDESNNIFHEILIEFIMNSEEEEGLDVINGINLNKDNFSKFCSIISRPLQPNFRTKLVPIMASQMGQYGQPFIVINGSNFSEKIIMYKDLEPSGDFCYVFAMQAFADLQITMFSLQSAATGFLSRIVSQQPSLIKSFILPSIDFHLKKRQSTIPLSELLIILKNITTSQPDLFRSLTKLFAFSFIFEIGSSDEGVRGYGLQQLYNALSEDDDWEAETMGRFLLPILCQLIGTPNIELALGIVCKLSSKFSVNKMLRRLLNDITSLQNINLLVSLCKAGAFTADQITEPFLQSIGDKKVTTKIQLQLISGLLSINSSPRVVSRLISYIIAKMFSKKPEIREVGQEVVIQLAQVMSIESYYEFFQIMRSSFKEGYTIPLMYVTLKNLVENAGIHGAFDSFIDVLVQCLLDDLFGHNAQLRQQMSVHLPEAKKCVTFRTFECLSKNIDFCTSSQQYLMSIVNKLNELKSLEQAKGAKKMINSISQGISDNETVSASILVRNIKILIDRQKQNRNKKNDGSDDQPVLKYGRMFEDEFLIEKPVRSTTENADSIVQRLGTHFLVSLLGVQLLSVFFEKDLFDIDDDDQKSLLDGLLPDLWEFTRKAVDKDTLVVSLSVLQKYSSAGVFPSFNTILPGVISFLTNELPKMSTAADAFGQRVFSFLSSILTTYTNIDLPTPFTRALVLFCMGQFDVHESVDSVFGVLLIVIDRRRDIPEVYDAADKAFELIVRAHSKEIRKNAARFCCRFLTTYKMKPAEFQKHIKYILGNLQSSKSQARYSILSFLNLFFKNAPEDQIDPFAELVFLYLSVQVANESDDAVNEKLSKTVGKLLRIVSNSRFLAMWELMSIWAKSGGNQVRSGLLMISIAIKYSSAALENTVPTLQEIFHERFETTNIKIKVASIELHKQMISAYPGNQSILLLTPKQICELLNQKETCKIACEILFWYLSNNPLFEPAPSDFELLTSTILDVIITWNASFPEAADSLYHILVKVSYDQGDALLTSILPKLKNIESSGVNLSLMRVFVATLLERSEESGSFLKHTLRFITSLKKSEYREVKKASEKAIEVLRQKYDSAMFSNEIALITEEEESIKEQRREAIAAEKLLNPEGLREQRKEEKKQRVIEKRRKKYLMDNGSHGTLRPIGIDGQRVGSVELAPEFRDK